MATAIILSNIRHYGLSVTWTDLILRIVNIILETKDFILFWLEIQHLKNLFLMIMLKLSSFGKTCSAQIAWNNDCVNELKIKNLINPNRH